LIHLIQTEDFILSIDVDDPIGVCYLPNQIQSLFRWFCFFGCKKFHRHAILFIYISNDIETHLLHVWLIFSFLFYLNFVALCVYSDIKPIKYNQNDKKVAKKFAG